MRRRCSFLARIVVLALVGCACSQCSTVRADPASSPSQPRAEEGARKKVLYINSYSYDIPWVRDTMDGLVDVFRAEIDDQGNVDSTNAIVDLRVVYMRSKRFKDEEKKRQAALEAKRVIDEWRPDVLIVSEDNAVKYLVSEHLRNIDLPIVFTGVNWDCSQYGLPCENVTGMIEVMPIPQLVGVLKQFAEGNHIGVIAADNLSERKHIEYAGKTFPVKLTHVYVSNLEEFEREFLKLQDRCDMVILSDIVTIDGFDRAAIRDFMEENTKKPTGSFENWLADFVAVSYAKRGQEHGAWAARTALDILAGRKTPAEIPTTMNKEGRILVNPAIAEKLGIYLPMNILKKASFVD